MNAATLKALRGSIAKWRGIVAGRVKDRGDEMTIAVCGHDIGPLYTSPTGKDCCQWCDDVRSARTEARAEALKEAAETAANASDSRECTDPHHDTRYCSTCQHVSLGCDIAAQAIEARLK